VLSDTIVAVLDNDEPLLSGSGVVSKDVTDENLLDSWHNVLKRWHQNVRQRPRQVRSLVHKGIPEPLRDEVWQLLAGCTESPQLLEAYRTLIPQVTVDVVTFFINFLTQYSSLDIHDTECYCKYWHTSQSVYKMPPLKMSPY